MAFKLLFNAKGVLECFIDASAQYREMSHFSARSRVGFAVEMQFRRGMLQNSVPVGRAVLPQIAEQVDHHGGAVLASFPERQIAQRAYLLLKLRRDAGIDRIMAAIMRPGGDFIHQKLIVLHDKKLHAEHALVMKPLRYETSDSLGLLR